MLSLSAAAILEKNQLANDGTWVVLLQIDFSASSSVHVCRNTADIVWPATGGNTYVAFPFDIDEVREDSKGEIPQLTLKVGNITQALNPYLEAYVGGVGATVTIRVVHSDHLDLTTPEVEIIFTCIGSKIDAYWAYFTLGIGDAQMMRIPRRRFIKDFCPYQYKGIECGVVAGTITAATVTGATGAVSVSLSGITPASGSITSFNSFTIGSDTYFVTGSAVAAGTAIATLGISPALVAAATAVAVTIIDISECNRSLLNCRARNNAGRQLPTGRYARFGGYPTIDQGGLYV